MSVSVTSNVIADGKVCGEGEVYGYSSILESERTDIDNRQCSRVDPGEVVAKNSCRKHRFSLAATDEGRESFVLRTSCYSR